MKILVGEGIIIPKYYGVGYYEDFGRVAVCYPIPLNVLMYYWHVFMCKIKGFGKPDKNVIEYHRGWRDGYNERIKQEEISKLITNEIYGITEGKEIRGNTTCEPKTDKPNLIPPKGE